MCLSVNSFKLNISAISRPIGMKFYLKLYTGGGKGFDQDRIRTLVSMATDTCSSHRIIMGKTASSCFLERL